jgi:hypothetical protein
MTNRVAQGLAMLLAGMVTALQAAPYTPASDGDIVEHLPARPDAAARRQRAELARAPGQWPLAVTVARAAIDRARREGDPRELGAAQAALAPWWNQRDAPAPVRLLRATIRQSQHDFEGALVDLDPLARDGTLPLAIQAQAGLTRAAVLQVTGRWSDAQAACRALQAPRFAGLGPALSVPARACVAELRSLTGQPREAAAQLAELARSAPADRWLALVRAELAQRLGDDTAARGLFRVATEGGDDIYALAAHADWLLDRGLARDALALLARGPADADALRLRRVIALRRAGDPQASSAASDLQARFAAARLRGENLHAREEGRFALEVLDDPAAALALARENWVRQKEPADAVLLWRAARATGQPAVATEALRGWVVAPARIDVRLVANDSRSAP